MALCCTVQCCPVLSWIIFRERSLCNVDSCRFGLLVKILFVQGFSLTFGSELYVCVWCTYSCVCMYVRSEFKSSCLNGKHCADWMLFPVWVCIYITRMLAWDSRLCSAYVRHKEPTLAYGWSGRGMSLPIIYLLKIHKCEFEIKRRMSRFRWKPWTSEEVQRTKAPAAKPDDLSLLLGTHTVDGITYTCKFFSTSTCMWVPPLLRILRIKRCNNEAREGGTLNT